MLIRSLWLLAMGVLALSPTAAAAAKPTNIATLASDLAYENCPLYLAGSPKALSENELRDLGFTGPKQVIPNSRVGNGSLITATFPDGELGFGGTPTKLCMLVAFPKDRANFTKRLVTDLTRLPYKFDNEPANSGDRPGGAHVETMVSKLDSGDVLRAQFATKVIQGRQAVTFSLFIMDQ